MEIHDETRIHLCGQFTVRWQGRRVEEELPGNQGRQLFAWLVLHPRARTPRHRLVEVLWGDSPPPAADSALAALLAKLRRVLGDAALDGRHDIQLHRPDSAWVDVEVAADALHRAESAAAVGDWARAWGPAQVVMHIAQRELLVGHDRPWVVAAREELSRSLASAFECLAESGLGIGGAELSTAERAARRLVQTAPLKERGWTLLMRIVSARGNPAEALVLYEQLRAVLREQLGATPGAQAQALHRSILTGQAA